MKYTYTALTSITVEKVENIITSMTRAGMGDDTYRRQRDKQRYLKCKAEQAQKEERQREEFSLARNNKQAQWDEKTKKKQLQRLKKKLKQQVLKQKHKFIHKFDAFHQPKQHKEEERKERKESEEKSQEENMEEQESIQQIEEN